VADTKQYAESFALIDADGDGLISAAELVRLMRALGDEVTDEAAAQAVELMDTDGDGQVSLDEFAGYLATRS
jgi:Ca2+-binding EF-hand superfamily protein